MRKILVVLFVLVALSCPLALAIGPMVPCQDNTPNCWDLGANRSTELAPNVMVLLFVNHQRYKTETPRYTNACQDHKPCVTQLARGIVPFFFLNRRDAKAWLEQQDIGPEKILAIVPYNPLVFTVAQRTVDQVVTQPDTITTITLPDQ